MTDPNPNDQYIPVDEARNITDTLNSLDPPIVSSEQAKVAVAVTAAAIPDLSQPANYYAVWQKDGFSQNCKTLGDMQRGYGNWAQMVRNEYAEWNKNHEPASQWGLPEGLTWYYVE